MHRHPALLSGLCAARLSSEAVWATSSAIAEGARLPEGYRSATASWQTAWLDSRKRACRSPLGIQPDFYLAGRHAEATAVGLIRFCRVLAAGQVRQYECSVPGLVWSVELVGAQRGGEGGPDGRGDDQSAADGVFGVAHRDGAAEDGDLDAVRLIAAAAALPPLGCAQVRRRHPALLSVLLRAVAARRFNRARRRSE